MIRGLLTELRDVVTGATHYHRWLNDEITEWMTGEGAWHEEREGTTPTVRRDRRA